MFFVPKTFDLARILGVSLIWVLSVQLAAAENGLGGNSTRKKGDPSAAESKQPDLSKHTRIMPAIGKALEDLHYKRSKLDNAKSQKILETFISRLDPNKVYLTRPDIDSLQGKYGALLDNAIRMGDVRPSLDIFSLYRQRALSRMQSNLELLERDYDFKGDAQVRLNRKNVDWEKDMAALDAMWEKRVEAELLQEHLAEEGDRDPKDILRGRYRQIGLTVEKMRSEEVGDLFLTSIMKAYDPHSEYLSADDMENFDISMRLSLVGIGAVLKQEDEKITIVEVVPGGPADVDGRLKPKDRLLAVTQEDGETVDVVGMKVDDVVKLIRGEKGTKVTLTVEPAADRALRSDIALVREVVKLTDAEARAELIEMGEGKKIGWLTLPSFYANLGGSGPTKSVTQDVAALLKRLNQEGIDGLVVDLRRDAGGSLDEAIDLTGLFIPKGPVVQSKDAKGNILISRDKNPKVAYTGPMVVLVNRLSASASEIFAAALQDYGRAVIVGDSKTFGKGTVQTVLDLSRVMAYLGVKVKNPGSLKLTVQQFYRVTGESIQLSGVSSDIVLPSVSDSPELSEEENPNRMGPDKVQSAKFDPWESNFDVEVLRTLSNKRVEEDREFAYVEEDRQLLQKRLAENNLSVSKEERRKQKEENEARQGERAKVRTENPDFFAPKVKMLSVQTAESNGELEVVEYLAAEQRGKEKLKLQDASPEDAEVADPVKRETLKIIADMIELSEAKIAAVRQHEKGAFTDKND
jgi:carboxyl-terminal processing protease